MNQYHDQSTAYHQQMHELDESLDDALAAIRAEQDAGRITTGQAATERITVLERHIAECRRLRAEHLGGE